MLICANNPKRITRACSPNLRRSLGARVPPISRQTPIDAFKGIFAVRGLFFGVYQSRDHAVAGTHERVPQIHRLDHHRPRLTWAGLLANESRQWKLYADATRISLPHHFRTNSMLFRRAVFCLENAVLVAMRAACFAQGLHGMKKVWGSSPHGSSLT